MKKLKIDYFRRKRVQERPAPPKWNERSARVLSGGFWTGQIGVGSSQFPPGFRPSSRPLAIEHFVKRQDAGALSKKNFLSGEVARSDSGREAPGSVPYSATHPRA